MAANNWDFVVGLGMTFSFRKFFHLVNEIFRPLGGMPPLQMHQLPSRFNQRNPEGS
jgi:hypothetical protein